MLIGKIGIAFIEFFFFVIDRKGAGIEKTGNGFDLFKIILQQRAKRWRYSSKVQVHYTSFGTAKLTGYAVNVFGFAIVLIIAQLMNDIGGNKQATGQSYG